MRFLIFALFMVLSSNAIAREGQRPTLESQTVLELLPEKPPKQPVEPNVTQDEPTEQPAIEADPVITEVAPIEPASEEHDDPGSEYRPEDTSQNGYLIFGDGMAQWIMAATGIAAFILSAWAVLLLYWTLKATRKMIGEAEKTTGAAIDGAKAAKETVDLTRYLGQRQLRAYLSAHVAFCQFSGDTIGCNFTIINDGATPATKVTASVKVIFPDVTGRTPIVASLKQDYFEGVKKGETVGTGFSVNPGVSIGPRLGPSGDFPSHVTMLMCVMLSYIDEFKDSQSDEIWFKGNVGHGPGHNMIQCAAPTYQHQ